MSRTQTVDDWRRAAFRAMTEEALLQDVRAFLTLHGWRSWHTRYSKGSDAGFPDLAAIHPAWHRIALLELKSEAGKLKPAQAETLRLFHDFGYPYECAVIRPSTWDSYAPWFVQEQPGSGPERAARLLAELEKVK